MRIRELQLDPGSSTPMYRQLCTALQSAVQKGTFCEGTRLPAERDLAKQLGISRTTVATAYRALEDRGLLRSHVGRGTFVCAVPESQHAPFAWRGKISARVQRVASPALKHLIARANDSKLISFAAGYPAVDLFPATEFRRLADRILATNANEVARLAPAEGQPRLRAIIAQRFKTRPEQVMIISGATEALNLIASCLIDEGDSVVMDRPGYVGAIQIFRAAGANVHGWDIRKADSGELEELIIRYRPKFIHTNPTFQNPTGHTLAERDRRELLALAGRYRIPVVEDDPYSDGYFDAPPPRSLHQMDGGTLVLYLSTFSKVLAPGLRLGWIIANEYMIQQLALVKERTNLFTETLWQLVMAEFIRSGAYDKHLALMRKEHSARSNALFTAMQRHLQPGALIGSKPAGGIYYWGRLTGALDASELLPRASGLGVSFATGEIFYPDEAGREHLRFCFANQTPTQIDEGIRRLAKSMAPGNSARPLSGKKLPLV